MELCTGGSLFNILDDPENSHGLEEGEFLLVLSHLGEFITDFLHSLLSVLTYDKKTNLYLVLLSLG